jgi:hypothetical protein
MSGPVKADDGRIAVAANIEGNWDIWVYDDQWHRITSAPSIELDPWWEADRLVFSFNVSGHFQIHAADMRQLTRCPTAAVLPRKNQFLCLTSNGWQISAYETNDLPEIASFVHGPGPVNDTPSPDSQPAKPYTPLKSIWPNYIRPDVFLSTTDFQIGLITAGQDVTRKYSVDAGARYSFDLDYFSAVAGGNAEDFGLRFNRYAISYTPKNAKTVHESRNEVRISWQPVGIRELEVAANSRWYEPLTGPGENNDKFWGFEDNILEAEEAFTAGVEVFWPLLNLQQGYKTLPLFLHRLRLGTFVDVGAAGDTISVDDALIGAGFELVTSMQIGWGKLSSFRVGLGWPVLQPDYLDESGRSF